MKYSLRFGRVKRPDEFESIRVEYEQDYDDEDIPRDAAWDDLKKFVYRKIEEELSEQIEREVEAPPAAKAKAEETEEEKGPLYYYYPKVESLEWRAFKEKRPAKPDEAAWIFTNTPEAKDLAAQVRREGAIFVRMGGHMFLCKISGDEGQFLQRIPQEKKEGK